jgi:hypothetical protein
MVSKKKKKKRKRNSGSRVEAPLCMQQVRSEMAVVVVVAMEQGSSEVLATQSTTASLAFSSARGRTRELLCLRTCATCELQPSGEQLEHLGGAFVYHSSGGVVQQHSEEAEE